jgi:hypothetical protein
MNLYIEVNTFLILSILGALIYEDLPTFLYNTIEWILVVLIYMSVMVPALVNLLLLIYKITNKIIMKIRSQNNHEKTKEETISRVAKL